MRPREQADQVRRNREAIDEQVHARKHAAAARSQLLELLVQLPVLDLRWHTAAVSREGRVIKETRSSFCALACMYFPKLPSWCRLSGLRSAGLRLTPTWMLERLRGSVMACTWWRAGAAWQLPGNGT